MTTNLAAIQDRALLYAARSVYMPPLAGTSPPKPQYRLVGTFIIPFKPAVALLSSANGAARKVKPGDSLDGWLVEAVEDRRVVLRYGSETFDIASAAAAKPGLTLQSAPLARQTPPVAGNSMLGSSGATAPTALNQTVCISVPAISGVSSSRQSASRGITPSLARSG